MNEEQKTKLATKVTNFFKKHVKFVIIAVICIAVLMARAKLAMEISGLEKENSKLQEALAAKDAELSDAQERLAYSESQVELLEDSTAALKEQVGALDATILDLNNRIEDMLNVQETIPVVTTHQLKEQLSSIGELSTLRYVYTNASRKEGSKTWLWGWEMPLSSASILATYDGTMKIGIDLNKIQLDVNERRRKITVTLPSSRIFDNYIPQGTINVLEVKDGLFNKITFDDYNTFISEETKAMEEKAVERGLLDDADKAARDTIEAFLKQAPGVSAYEIEFR